ncbi:Uncharacterized protein Adt_39812 [Abeliophyllum distichum]|uniref:Retrotransposon Copia-like N-terminal domain-containing protein n=1 Tax=Abeliophyllum distichum TaxID=126358 RepID=A0ABD1Q681_9LAMI
MANADSTSNTPTLPSDLSSLVAPLLGGNHLSPFGMNLTQTPSVKLEKNNFLLWQSMILPIIRGHNLEGFILGSKKCPSEFLGTQTTTGEGKNIETIPNPEYSKWMSIDQLLMG